MYQLPYPLTKNGSFNYKWHSNASGSWGIIPGAISTTFSPGYMDTSTLYTLEVVSNYDVNCISRYTDSIYIQVYDSLNPGIIDSNQVICFDTSKSRDNSLVNVYIYLKNIGWHRDNPPPPR